MSYTAIIQEELRRNKVSITKAAFWLEITRAGFYKKMDSGNFFVQEIGTLVKRGAISKRKAIYLLTAEEVQEKFEAGQQVECTLKDAVWTSNEGKQISGPKYKEVCTVSGVHESGDLLLKEYPLEEGYWVKGFKKVKS